MVGRIVLNMSVALYKVLNPPKPPGPTFGFGALPPVEFPTPVAQIDSYRLETRTGSFPAFPNVLPVYFIPVNKVGLFSADRAKQIAASLGFVFPPEELSSTEYRWKRTVPLPATLDINIVTLQLKMKTDWASDPNFLARKSLPQQNAVGNEARNILRNANLLLPDMATGEARVSFLKSSGVSYRTAVSYSEADFLQVDVFRTMRFQQYPILRYDPSLGNARLIYSGSSVKDQRLLDFSYSASTIDYETVETYPLITAAQAFEMLKAGQGYVAQANAGITQAVVRNVSLAYFDSDTEQHYLQPIYVFSGDAGFVGYVPAVSAVMPVKK